MDLEGVVGSVAEFLRDDRGGESVECALTCVVTTAAAVAAQRAMADELSRFTASAFDAPFETTCADRVP